MPGTVTAVIVRIGTRSELGDLEGTAASPEAAGALVDRLVAARLAAAGGASAAVWVRLDDGPVAAVVTAAVEAGSTVIVLADEIGQDPELRREARRAADVATALVRERGAVRS